jgi:hypothetical protein
MRIERDAILAIDDDLLHPWERKFRMVVELKMETGGVSFKQKDHPRLASWMLKQRNRYKNIENMKRPADKPKTLDDCALLKRIGFDLDSQPPPNKSFEERFQELVAYKEQHGDLKIPRLTEGNNVGEWVAKIRREYDRIPQGKTSTYLTPTRIQAMSDLGFIWKVRFGRPKKGDPKYRLRRKKEGEEEEGEEGTATLEENRGYHNGGGTATTTTSAASSIKLKETPARWSMK